MFDTPEEIRRFLASNEFSEVCTGDMNSMDSAIHYMLNPQKCDFPEAAERQRKWWNGKNQIKSRNCKNTMEEI